VVFDSAWGQDVSCNFAAGRGDGRNGNLIPPIQLSELHQPELHVFCLLGVERGSKFRDFARDISDWGGLEGGDVDGHGGVEFHVQWVRCSFER
jgi:hypothetical protein